MLQETKDLFSDEILHQALQFFGGTKEKCKDLGGFESFVYELEINNKFYILKITHTNRRTVDYILAELEFVNYLESHGVPTSRAILSTNGNYVETIDSADGGKFITYLFEKAEGLLSTFKDWNDDFLFRWGKLAGMINRLAKDFVPSKPQRTRQVWHTDDTLLLEKYIPDYKQTTISNSKKLIETMKTFPKDKDSYGLVHGDLHHGNFFHHKNIITPFDFDDCSYDYFANDIAMPLYYALPDTYVKRDYGVSNIEFGENFLFHFLKGYRTENQITKEWVLRIPYFLQLRSVLLFTVFNQVWAEDELDYNKTEIIERLRSFADGETIMLDIDYGNFT